MSSRKGSTGRSSKAGRSFRSRSPPPAPPQKQQRGHDVVIVQPQKSPGLFGTFAGTAAGVAAGTVIGDKITGRNDPPQTPAASEESHGPCKYEEEQLVTCTLNQNELQFCM
ncbi:hemiasterlin resistant protein 1-like isoform X2 [Belonocnema kinseyi]|uniref:hemiasterlin resistant protein 1-like isoform X2 n=1 Tax=Belonocnema kinseyi TaxID=2817044 RepID=UPI00143CFB66|nr:hemiasterlin resistant protein 1-like isoform X2 [Belonocnema kinseyi]